MCHEAINTVYEMEKQLYDNSVISLGDTNIHLETNSQENILSNKSLIQLESTLLHMAAAPELCEGVLYIFPIKIQDNYVVR